MNKKVIYARYTGIGPSQFKDKVIRIYQRLTTGPNAIIDHGASLLLTADEAREVLAFLQRWASDNPPAQPPQA